jgi:hypothetical protein
MARRSAFQCTLIAASALATSSLTSAPAGAVAHDDASDPAYDDGWQNGDEGGAGWAGGWELFGFDSTVESSATNGNGDGNGDGDIDTAGSRAWLLATPMGSGAVRRAERTLAAPLAVGEQIVLDFDNEASAAGGYVGFELLSPGGIRFRFRWVGDSESYVAVDGGSTKTLAVPYTDEGFRLVFELTASNDYTLFVVPRVGARDAVSGFLNLTGGDEDIDTIRLEAQSDGTGARRHFFNSITVPEAEAGLAGGAALVACGVLTRLAGRR